MIVFQYPESSAAVSEVAQAVRAMQAATTQSGAATSAALTQLKEDLAAEVDQLQTKQVRPCSSE
jgi:hypothetical protein